jgi:signal transduction histidine kinase
MFARVPVRWRLALGGTVIAAVILAVALVAVHLQVAALLASSNEQLARADVAGYVAEIGENPSGIADDTGEGVLVFVRDPSGRVLVDTLPHEVHEAVEHRRGAEETFRTDADGTPYVVAGDTVAAADGTWSVWAARSEASSALAIESLDRFFAVGALALLAVFALLSWRLAVAALRPVERMRREAETLKTAPLGADARNLPVSAADDELADLATTLNDFLARVRESAEREKQMVSDAAHELRTPLAALRVQLELAHDDFGDAQALAEEVTAAEASVARLSSLTNNLLELSRLESGEGPPARSSGVDLVTETMGSVDRARMLALTRDVDVAFTVDDPAGAQRFAVSTDGFGRLVDNLLANAVAAVDDGGSVSVDLRVHDDSLTLTVTDDGGGMPEDFLPRAFDRFTRADGSRAAHSGGTGLGLALVAAIVETAGGTVTLRNAAPGFAVTVTLPKM